MRAQLLTDLMDINCALQASGETHRAEVMERCLKKVASLLRGEPTSILPDSCPRCETVISTVDNQKDNGTVRIDDCKCTECGLEWSQEYSCEYSFDSIKVNGVEFQS